MLPLKYLFENYDLAKECLQLYDYSEKHLDKMLSYFRISSNAVYPFWAKEGRTVCFLRLSPVEEKNIRDVETEIHFIEWLIENGFNAMKPYPMKNGKAADVITTKWGKYNVSCFEKVAGETLDDMDGTDETAFGYGKLLGTLHNLAEKYPYADERRDYRALLGEAKSRLEQYRAPATVLHYYDTVMEQLTAMPQTPNTYGIIHYDFEADNVLYDDETDTWGVIDFDDAVRCWYALDVTRAIDAIGDVVEGDTTGAAAAFLAGYRSVRLFTAEQEATIPLMRGVVRLQAYGTILHVLADPPAEEPDWLTEVKQKLTGTLCKIEDEISCDPYVTANF